MKKWRYTGDEAISDLRSECHSIEEVKVKKIGEKWIIRLYTYLSSVFELTVTDIKRETCDGKREIYGLGGGRRRREGRRRVRRCGRWMPPSITSYSASFLEFCTLVSHFTSIFDDST